MIQEWNWLLILGIDLNAIPDDEGAIKQVIEKKRGEFTNKGNKNNADAAYFKELAAAIKEGKADEALLDASARKQQEAQARVIVNGTIDAAIEEALLVDPSLSDGVEAGIAKAARDAIRGKTGIAKYSLPKDMVVRRTSDFKKRNAETLQAGMPDEEEIEAVCNKYLSGGASEEVERVFNDIERYISSGGTVPRDFALRQVAILSEALDDPRDAPALLVGYTRRNEMTLGASYADLMQAASAATANKQANPDTNVKSAATSAGKAAAEAVSGMKTKTKRNIVLGVAIAVVAAIAIAIIATVVGNVQEQQHAETEHQALVDSLDESRLISNVSERLKEGDWPVVVVRNPNNPRILEDYSVQSVSIDSRDSTNNLMTANCTVVISNGSVEQTTAATAHLAAENDVWNVKSWDFGESTVKAVKEIDAYVAKRLGCPIPKGSAIDFDEASQTCKVAYAAPAMKWYGGETGQISYLFKFTQTGWEVENRSGEIKTSFNSAALVGTYQVTALNNPPQNPLKSFEIKSVDANTGTITAKYEPEGSEGGEMQGTIDTDGIIDLSGNGATFRAKAGPSEGTIENGSYYGGGLANSTVYTLKKQ